MRARRLSLVFFLMLFSSYGNPQPRASFAIQPLGELDPGFNVLARSAIWDAFGPGPVEILPAQPLAKSAFYAPRKRYRAEKLLIHLEGLRDKRFAKIIGLAAVDVSTTKGPYEDWGIFGMADLGGSCCIVSTYRLGRDGAGVDLVASRFRKVVTHEVGHVLGLPHCPSPGCIMQDAQGKITTIDESNGVLCKNCRQKLVKSLASCFPEGESDS